MACRECCGVVQVRAVLCVYRLSRHFWLQNEAELRFCRTSRQSRWLAPCFLCCLSVVAPPAEKNQWFAHTVARNGTAHASSYTAHPPPAALLWRHRVRWREKAPGRIVRTHGVSCMYKTAGRPRPATQHGGGTHHHHHHSSSSSRGARDEEGGGEGLHFFLYAAGVAHSRTPVLQTGDG